MVCRQELSDLLNVELLRGPREDFDRIEPQRGGLLTSAGQVVPENKRTAARFRDQRDGNGGSHARDILTRAKARIAQVQLTFRNLVMRPVWTHSATKMLPAGSKHAS